MCLTVAGKKSGIKGYNNMRTLQSVSRPTEWQTFAGLVLLVVVAISLCANAASASNRIPRWATPLRVPAKPHPALSAHDVSLIISGPVSITSGSEMAVRVKLSNKGQKFFSIVDLVPPWVNFPGTWCWGPAPGQPSRVLRFVSGGFRGYYGGSARGGGAPSGGKYFVALPLYFSHIFDLSVPGKYKAQLAGKGMVSNVITFHVLPPKDRSSGPAIREFAAKLPRSISWGNVWHGVQIAACIKANPNADPIARVQTLFRCVGKHAASISLTGNPHIDFASRQMAGPFDSGIKAIDGKPAPLTAYGKLLANRSRKHLPTAQTYTLKPGVVYTYWRRLVLNREFDLSMYGPYRFSAQLHGTELKTAPVIIYIGVQSRFYAHWKMPK